MQSISSDLEESSTRSCKVAVNEVEAGNFQLEGNNLHGWHTDTVNSGWLYNVHIWGDFMCNCLPDILRNKHCQKKMYTFRGVKHLCKNNFFYFYKEVMWLFYNVKRCKFWQRYLTPQKVSNFLSQEVTHPRARYRLPGHRLDVNDVAWMSSKHRVLPKRAKIYTRVMYLLFCAWRFIRI